MVQLIVFDMAGTTLHDGDAVSSCFRAALAGVGVNPTQQEINDVMGFPKPLAIRTLATAAGRTLTEAELNATHADFVARMTRYYKEDPAVREIPGAAEVFAELRRRGIKIALNTGFSRAIVDVILDRLGWKSKIDATIASDESPRGRPFPDMIFTLMKKVGVTDAASVAKVGDTPSDLEEGISAGCGLVVGVTTGAFTRAQLEANAKAKIVNSVVDVLKLI